VVPFLTVLVLSDVLMLLWLLQGAGEIGLSLRVRVGCWKGELGRVSGA
jgi:hypothetical protein